MLATALRYPLSFPGWMRNLAIGYALAATAWLIVPGLALLGYNARILDDPTDRPVFSSPVSLVVTGAKMCGIAFLWFIIPLVILSFVLAALEATALTTVVTAVFGIVYLYFVSAAMAAYARTRTVYASFDAALLTEMCLSRAYFRAFLLNAVVVGGILGAVIAVGQIGGSYGEIVTTITLPGLIYWMSVVCSRTVADAAANVIP